MCNLADFKHLDLDSYHAGILKAELGLWHRTRATNLKGKTVFEAGAGNGESAQFYLNHGAEHVIAVEPFADLLRKNFRNDKRVTIIPRAIDYINLDGEGCEKNMTVEIHFPHRWRYLTYGYYPDRVSIARLEEYWGSPPRKALRLLNRKILFRLCTRTW